MRLLALAPLLLLVTPVIPVLQDHPGQKPPAEKPPISGVPDTRAKPAANKADGVLANWLLIGHNNEVAIAQIGQQRAQDPEVKQFAQKMADDHRQLTQKLQSFAAPGFGGTPPGGMTGRGEELPGASGKPREAGAGMDSQFDHGALIQELGKQCLDTARKELESKSGAEFDRCFMGAMVAGHMHANDMLTVFQRHASPELKNVLTEAQRTVAAHLQQAKDISKRLDSASSTKAPKTEDGPK